METIEFELPEPVLAHIRELEPHDYMVEVLPCSLLVFPLCEREDYCGEIYSPQYKSYLLLGDSFYDLCTAEGIMHLIPSSICERLWGIDPLEALEEELRA